MANIQKVRGNVANEYKNKIPEEVYSALLNYEVRIENDKNYVVA